MLHYLRIKNLALMEEVALDFEGGFTAVTGETGAGKSVLLGALSLLAGNRADKSIVRRGADACEVEASLHLGEPARVEALLVDLGLPPCEEGVLVLRRVIPRDKPARIQVNGALATLAALQQLGELWVDFHGPGEPQKLFHERYQIEMLDLFARNQAGLEAYQSGYRAWREKLREADELSRQDRLSEDELEFLRGQVAKIDEVSPTVESIAELERDFKRLSRAREFTEFAVRLESGLGSDEGLLSNFPPLLRAARELCEIDASTKPLADRLDALAVEAGDLASEFGALARGAEFDEEHAQAVQAKMNLWLELKRRHGGDVEAVLQKRAALALKIERQGDVEGMVEKLRAEAAQMEGRLRKEASALTTKRAAAAKDLGKKAQRLLGSLGFKKAALEIRVVPQPDLAEHGDSSCQFLFSANAGQDLLPLNKIASSGETARVMLALKAVLAEVDRTPLLVFDEVDANVGGEIGAEVGRELAALAGRHQVFCVTHLPQVAACARQHFVVAKEQTAEATAVTIKPIHAHSDARVVELARMLGDRASKSALTHARELLGL